MRFLTCLKAILLFVTISSSSLGMQQRRPARGDEERIQAFSRSLTDVLSKRDIAGLKNILTKNRVDMNLEVALNEYNSEGLAPIHKALVDEYDLKIIELLLEYGADPNQRISRDFKSRIKNKNIMLYKSWTAAHIAVRYSTEKTLLMLLKHGTNFFVKDSLGWSPQQLAKKDRRFSELAGFFKKALQDKLSVTEEIVIKPQYLALKAAEIQKIPKLPKAPIISEEIILKITEKTEPQVAIIPKPLVILHEELEADLGYDANNDTGFSGRHLWMLTVFIISFYWGFIF